MAREQRCPQTPESAGMSLGWCRRGLRIEAAQQGVQRPGPSLLSRGQSFRTALSRAGAGNSPSSSARKYNPVPPTTTGKADWAMQSSRRPSPGGEFTGRE